MKVTILAFAVARQRLGFTETSLEADPAQTPRDVLAPWAEVLANLPKCRVAVDQAFHDWDTPIGDASEIAIIPPVSGG